MRNALTTHSFLRRVAAFVVLSGLHGSALAAQPPVAQRGVIPAARTHTDSGFAILNGVVIDSLNGGYLPGAIIAVSGTARMAITDSVGRFRIDGIAPGKRRIDVYHASLDELGIALVTPQMELLPRDSMSVELALPSAASITTALCQARERALGPAAVIGQVVDAENQAPIAGARISVQWFEYVVNKKKVGTSLERRDALSAADGHFRICGLPSEFTAILRASFGGDTTAKIPVRFDPIVAVTTLRLAPSYSAAENASAPTAAGSATIRAQRPGAGLTGKVIDPKGGAVSGARVAVDRPGKVALTTADGRFALQGIRPGTRSLYVRRIGYQPVEVPIDLNADSPADLTVQLADFVPLLDTVVVTAMLPDLGLERVGFAQRRKTGKGTYLGPDQIKRRRGSHFTDLFTTVPGLRRSTYADGRPVLIARAAGPGKGCVDYFVDDMHWSGGGVEDFISPAEVGAIEVYSSASTPSQFKQVGSLCETVVVWTKPKLRLF